MPEKFIQSYIEDRYFVSTALRDSSAPADPSPFYETLAWEWDKATGKRGKLIEQEGHSGNFSCGLLGHMRVCRRLLLTNPDFEDVTLPPTFEGVAL